MKTSIDQLGVFGGPSMFDTPLLVGRPNELNRKRFLDRVERVLDSGMLTNGGAMVCEFEQRIAESVGVRHAVAVCNGTMALQIMSRACGLSGEVIVPSMTFIATAHALEWMGLTPVFADIDPVTHTVDPASVERCISSETTAIMGVHLWGNLCDFDALRRIAHEHKLRLLFDASHAFGCERGGDNRETFGDAEAISFHATKALQAIEGGAVLTNDDDIAERARLQRNFGITGLNSVGSVGTNGKMNEICAAAGLTSLEQSDTILEANNDNLRAYRKATATIPGITVAIPESPLRINAQYVVVTVKERQFGLSRDELMTVLLAEGVFTRSYFAPGCHQAQPYAGVTKHVRTALTSTEQLSAEVMQLPTGTSVSGHDIERICEFLRFVHEHSEEIRARFHQHYRNHRLPPRRNTASAA